MSANGVTYLDQQLAKRMSESGQVKLTNGETASVRAIEWLWREYLAKGKFHILGGSAGSFKTTISMNLAATVTIGGRWPDGTIAAPGDVLVWSGEDDFEDTLLPRFMAMGGDGSRLHFISGTYGDEGLNPFDPARDMINLLSKAGDIKPSLLILDPVVSAVSGDSHKNSETRRGLQPVVDFAHATGAAVLGITHFSKNTSGREPLERFTGSLAFGALPRIALAAGKVEIGGDTKMIITRAKSNIGPDGGGFEYHSEQLPVPGYDMAASCVLWGEPLQGSARELLQSDEPEKETKLGRAAEWLEDYLSRGPAWATEVYKLGDAEGFPQRTLKRAKAEIGATSRRVDDRWQWFLPQGNQDQQGQNLPHNIGPLDNGQKPAPQSHISQQEDQEGQQCQELDAALYPSYAQEFFDKNDQRMTEKRESLMDRLKADQKDASPLPRDLSELFRQVSHGGLAYNPPFTNGRTSGNQED